MTVIATGVGVGAAAALAWLLVLALPWQPWRMRETFEADPAAATAGVDDLTVIVPARNEAQTLARVLDALGAQGPGLQIIVVDDHSDDATGAIASRHPLAPRVLASAPLPNGWTGKLWALEQARQIATTSRIVLLDADIVLAPGTLAGLRERALSDDRQLVSLMAHLRMASAAERLLIPAFVYFFKLLYPFALSNRGSRWVAAAAGGCVLVDAGVLARIGGFGALAGKIIDDCALAGRVRAAGGRTWVGVSHSATSLRGYDDLAGIHAMVARSAFTQLGYSTAVLVAATILMALMFCAPPLVLAIGPGIAARLAALAALVAMTASFLPTLAYYRVGRAWALTLPLAGALYLAMTWSSAMGYWRGVRSAWRGRTYARE